ncbi:telomerase-binding protein EST1A [Galendromus occidentalis]|uniref:Telomerase-binding protein EST1A n=1 Tax=Galendromus occidentalis TaxID=34638 RepID=A0AAJ7SJ47_9ACAR|nr:telomerase-binding protein EST1A [Galendromus occidentalis]
MVSGGSPHYALLHRQLKEAISKNLQEAQELEGELAAQLPVAAQADDGIAQLTDLRFKIRNRYEHVVLNDPRFSAEKNIEQLLWKAVYYQVIETLRREMEFGVRTPESVRANICEIVEEGTLYYENLLEQLQGLHGFNLNEILRSEQPHVLGSRGSMKMVSISAHKILIYLGDLCRYREQALESANFVRARDYYLKAQQLAPKNGKPYNQLALLAVYSRRKLDAVYHYMRSLAVSNPFLTAKESLTTLFDEVRKKYEAQEKMKKQLEANKSNSHLALPEQCEIWIRPDGSSWQRRGDSELEQKQDMIEELRAMSDLDLLKQFTSSFLHVHGKLFSKIGMDQFSDAAKQMMVELKCLLRKPLGPGGGARYLQLLTICIFSVANNSLKNAEALDSNARSLMQEHSVQIALAFVTHLMERCSERIDEYLRQRSGSDDRILPEDVEELLPVLKVWTDWMSGHKMLWCPPPNMCDFSTSTKGDVWTALAELLNALQRAENLRSEQQSKLFSEAVNAPSTEELVLPEDTIMAGFVPVLNSPIDPFLAGPVPSEHREAFRTMVRIHRLNFFADYLCGLKKPYLSYDVYHRTYGSLIVDNGRQDDDCADDEDNLVGNYESQTGSSEHSENEDANVLDTSLNEDAMTEVDKLRKKKHNLQKRMRHQNRVDAYIERVLNNNRGATILEIRPRYLIPDTNCLVDHLELIQRLVACKKFSIYIPIVVVNELDGLARGTNNSSGARAHQDPEHAARVTAFAQDALSYLKEMFNAREPKLRTITSRGSLLDSIAFRTETGTENAGSNDDVILSCAISLSREQSLQPGETEAPLKLFREAVLLTADRNLAVKAISHNVPVRDLASFIRWAQVPRLDQRQAGV